VTLELAPGVYGGEKGLAAYLAFHGVASVDQIGQDLQLTLTEEVDDRDPAHLSAEHREAA
jgi:hypothetical protein